MLKKITKALTKNLHATPLNSSSALFRRRTSYKPFDYPWAVMMATDHEKIHWFEDEAKVDRDVEDWNGNKLTEAEKYQVHEVLKVFTTQDMTVASFYADKLAPIFQNNDIAMMIRAFNQREDVHQRAYDLLNSTLGFPDSDHSAFTQEQEMADKIDFAMEADTSTIDGVALALVKGVINEGLSLFGSFIPLLNYQRRGLMKGMGTVVEWSIRDETQHVIGVTALFRAVVADHPEIMTDAFKKKVYDMFRQAIVIEDMFVDRIYKMGPVEGLEKDDLKLFLRFLADSRLLGLGFKANWNIKENPVGEWLDWILNATDHSNFFEKKVTEYEVAGLKGKIDYNMPLEKAVIFTREGCSFCREAKTLLDLHHIPYVEIDLTDKDLRADWFVANRYEKKTMPQIYHDTGRADWRLGSKDRIGGYDDLAVLLSAL